MADPFAIIQLADRLITFSVKLYNFSMEAKRINATVEGLRTDINGIQRVLRSIQTSVQDTSMRTMGPRAIQDLRTELHNSVEQCQAISLGLERLISTQTGKSGFWEKTVNQLRLNRVEAEMLAYREQFKAHSALLQLCLQSLNLYISSQTPSRIDELSRQMNAMNVNLQRFTGGKSVAGMDSPGRPNQDSTPLARVTRSARTLMSTANTIIETSTAGGSETETMVGDDFDILSIAAEQRIGNWVSMIGEGHDEIKVRDTALRRLRRRQGLVRARKLLGDFEDTQSEKQRLLLAALSSRSGKKMDETVDALLACGAELDYIVEWDNQEGTYLMKAACDLDAGLVTRLLEFGADCTLTGRRIVNSTSQKTASEASPLHFACNVSRGASSEAARYQILRALVDAGTQINTTDSSHTSPLYLLCLRADHESLPSVKYLLEAGADVNAPGPGGTWTALHIACSRGNSSALVNMIIKAGADTNLQDSSGYAPLHVAVKAKTLQVLDIARSLISAGASVNATNNEGETPLNKVCAWEEKGALGVVKALIAAGADPNIRDTSDCTPMTMICGAAHDHVITIVKALIAAKWDPLDTNEKDRWTTLHRVCYQQTALSLEIVDTLIAAGSDPNAADVAGKRTPLHIACEFATNQEYSLIIVEHLLAAKSGPNATDIYGATPLYELCTCRNKIGGAPMLDMVKVLIAAGAGVNIACQTSTPLYALCSDYVDETPTTAIVAALLAAGADINAARDTGSTPLHLIAGRGTSEALEVVELLLQAGANVNARNLHGRAPLQSLTRESLRPGYGIGIEVVRRLMSAGADINEKDTYGFTPLFHACWAPIETFKQLVQLGANPLTIAVDGGTLLHVVAYGGGQVEVAEYLLDQGVSLTARKAGLTAIEFAAQYGHEKLITLLLEKYKQVDIKEKSEIDSAFYFAGERGHPACGDLLWAASPMSKHPLEPRPTQAEAGKDPEEEVVYDGPSTVVQEPQCTTTSHDPKDNQAASVTTELEGTRS